MPAELDELATRVDNSAIPDLLHRVKRLEDQFARLATSHLLLTHATRATLRLGYAMGMALAIVLSWSKHASILWCVGHGLLSWGYVIYFAANR
ncbi:MAG TPA: hypothetical protein VH744_00630 [Terriglobales bacterium]